MEITRERLIEIGFVPTVTFGRRGSVRGRSGELNWRGAPLWRDGEHLYYQKMRLQLSTIPEAVEFIKSLKIPVGRGKRPV